MFDQTFPEYSLYQLGQSSESLQRQGYECSPQIDFIPLLPQNPVTSKFWVNLASYFSKNHSTGDFVDIKGTTQQPETVIKGSKKSDGADFKFKLW